MSDDQASPPDPPDLRRVRELYVALSILEERGLAPVPPVSLSDLVTFLCGNLSLSDAQQDFLFSSERLLADFHSLVNDFAVPRRASGWIEQPDEAVKIIHLPLRAAASDDTALKDWRFPGGLMRIREFGGNERLLTITLDDDYWAQTPGFLLLENSSRRRLALVSLARPEPSFAAGINLIRNLDVPDHARQIEILQNPNYIGTFLR
jgi:hypothetical protein